MVYPTTLRDKLKYWFWRVYTPIHPKLRDTATYLGVLDNYRFAKFGRQDFLLGTLHPERSVYDFVTFLIAQGFGNHFVAWKDEGEIVGLRKTVGFQYQYHIRIFRDGEVRVHYEYTPEYRPLHHLIQVGFEDRLPEFQEFLNEWVVPAK